MRTAVRLLALACATLAFAPELSAQDEDTVPARPASHRSLDLPARGYGLGIGNSARHTGLRINAVDDRVERVVGVNLTLWRARENPDFHLTGLALGLVAPEAARIDGVAAGLAAVVAEERMRGIGVGGLAVVTEGDLQGIGVGGLAVIAQRRIDGVGVGGLAVIGDRGINGLAVGGLATVAEGDVNGITAAGLATIAEGRVRGISVGVLASIVDGEMTGISAGGLANVSEGPVRGVTLGGLGVVADGPLDGVNVGGLLVVGEQRVRWLSVGGLAVVAGEVEGLGAALAHVRTGALNGVAVSGYNDVRGRQRGLSIGLYNYARELKGVQIGVLNYVRSNPPGRRLLPILNFGS